MGINRKIGAAITATMLLAFNVSSSPPATAIFRANCTESDRGIGWVSGTSTRNSVALQWSTAPNHRYQTIHVCYKKNWSFQGKCGDTDRQQNETYGSPVSSGTIIIRGLDKNTCYKFAVYGGDVDKLIGMKKIKTSR
ncbi:hypothetical protein [Microcoleus sp. MON2_D5]|uniref:hypothetical protein n=1 Tax=Microcoleus sp. MON2_D5 TaxID=2818833 RepID=UPI002FD6E13E